MDSWKNKQKVIVQLVCILLSLCLWIYVTNIKNPIKSYELKNVPVEILNSNSLQDSGLALVPNQNFTRFRISFSSKSKFLCKLKNRR